MMVILPVNEVGEWFYELFTKPRFQRGQGTKLKITTEKSIWKTAPEAT
jgi:hypothetical protein